MKFLQAADHPKIDAFNKVYLSMIDVLQPKVFTAFIEVCESEELARQAITIGKDPLIKIARLVKNGYHQKNIGGQYTGDCDPTEKNIVFINTTISEAYNENNNGELLERVMLHEMVHWARFVGGKPGRVDGREAGSHFESLAYGKEFSNHWEYSCPAK